MKSDGDERKEMFCNSKRLLTVWAGRGRAEQEARRRDVGRDGGRRKFGGRDVASC